MRTRTLLPALALGLAACGGSEPTRAVPREEMGPAARAYLDAALDIMQANSLHRARIEWTGLRARAYDTAGTAQTPAETYPAIRSALRDLGDRHSSFAAPPSSTGGGGGTQPPPAPPPVGVSLAGGIAYVYMPAFVASASTEHANAYHAVLRDLDAASPCGWVVDVRLNPGGNMWPMLAGIGPVLGEGEVGRFVAPDGATARWWSRDGQAGVVSPGGVASVLARVSVAPYRLKRPMPPVAVLTGPVTASSGEAVVTAFRGRPDTRSFGRSTAGLSTANLAYRLSDGAVINLTVSTFADRTGRLYGQSIAPDEVIPVSNITRDPATDQTLRAAVEWLREQPPCRG
jgi:hypothetical protein